MNLRQENVNMAREAAQEGGAVDLKVGNVELFSNSATLGITARPLAATKTKFSVTSVPLKP
jgi:hypothetical protein